MQVIYNIGRIKKVLHDTVVAIGVFDGVHRGHQKLIAQAVARAKEIQGQPVVMTFYPHPAHVLHPERSLAYIVSLSHRLKLLEQLGVAVCVVVKFTKNFSRLTPQTFVQKYLVDKLHATEVFIGDDFRFGQNRAGTLDLFKELGEQYGFKVNGVKAVKESHADKVSSSHIRNYIQQGHLNEAAELLGRPVAIWGTVQRGAARGKGLGYPTINLYPREELLPRRGVYAVRVQLDGRSHAGMANVGVRPSFERAAVANVEVHLFDFTGELYGQEVEVEFCRRLRDEQTFETRDQLIQQLHKDERAARRILKN